MTARLGAPGASLTAMLEARTVAVVGASPRPGSFGSELMRQLRIGGFTGAVYPVNPRHAEVDGLPCLPSLDDLPGPVDLAILGVGRESLESALRGAAGVGARSAVIFAGSHQPAGAHPPLLGERLAAIAREAGMALCGGNGMGFVNLDRRLRATGYSQAPDLLPGPVTFLTQSGSSFSALLRNQRGIRFNLVVSGGDELVTTMADYLQYALTLESTRVVAIFMETVRTPGPFRDALEVAAGRDIPVVALKVGRGELAREMVTAHSGALAGEDAAYDALFDAYGVLRVHGLDELTDTVALLCDGRRATAGGLATVHDSGGERTHLIDLADACGVRLARIGAATRERLAEVLEPGLPPVNPLDAWDTSANARPVFTACLQALHDDPDTAVVALAVDLVADEQEDDYPAIALEASATSVKPFAVICNLRSAIDQEKARSLRDAGIAVLEGTETGLRAIGHLMALRDFAARRATQAPPAPHDPRRARHWRARLRTAPLGEAATMDMLAAYGIPTVACREVSDLDGALSAAAAIGWPVALKTAAPDVTHKTDVDGVRLDIGGPRELRAAHRDITARLGPRVTVAAMVAGAGNAVEMHLGAVRDAQFGPLVVVAAGGELVEALDDRSVALAPIDVDGALAMIGRLRVSRVLDGIRGRPAVDRHAVACGLAALSRLAAELDDVLDAIDINPLIASPQGCVAADALVVTAAAR